MILSEQNVQEVLFDKAVFRKLDTSESCYSSENKLGKFAVTSQQMGSHQFIKWQSLFSEQTKIFGEMATPSLRIYFLNKSTQGFHSGLEKQYHQDIKQGNTNILFSGEDCKGFSYFGKNSETDITAIVVTAQHFAKLAQQYPDAFEILYKRYQKEQNFILSQSCLPISFEVNTILQQLENCHIMGCSCGAYADLKVLELLLLLLRQIDNFAEKTYLHCKTTSDIDKLHEAKHFLTKDLFATPSLTELSRKVGLNEKKLKYGFKEVFGTTVFGYLFDYKMQLAKQLLLDTDKQISEVALLCGYDYISHFSTAFKRKYGVSPLEVRKLKQF